MLLQCENHWSNGMNLKRGPQVNKQILLQTWRLSSRVTLVHSIALGLSPHQ